MGRGTHASTMPGRRGPDQRESCRREVETRTDVTDLERGPSLLKSPRPILGRWSGPGLDLGVLTLEVLDLGVA